jgi:hypothetical protein
LAAINRAVQPVSQRGLWQWPLGTVLARVVPGVSEALLSRTNRCVAASSKHGWIAAKASVGCNDLK